MRTLAIATSTAGPARSTSWKSCSPKLIRRRQGGRYDMVARQLPLERVDDTRRRAREEILPRHDRLDVRGHADGARHLLGGENGRQADRRDLPADLAAIRRRSRELDVLS